MVSPPFILIGSQHIPPRACCPGPSTITAAHHHPFDLTVGRIIDQEPTRGTQDAP
jgi:hypothetical protein